MPSPTRQSHRIHQVHERRSEIQGAVRKFVQFGDPRAYHRYWEGVAQAQRHVEQRAAQLGLQPQQTSDMLTIFARGTELATTEEIAMLLTVWAYALPEASFPEVANLQWEHSRDVYRQRLRFPNRQYWPLSHRNDMKLDSAEQVTLSREGRLVLVPVLGPRRLCGQSRSPSVESDPNGGG